MPDAAPCGGDVGALLATEGGARRWHMYPLAIVVSGAWLLTDEIHEGAQVSFFDPKCGRATLTLVMSRLQTLTSERQSPKTHTKRLSLLHLQA
jgi:hypothetical protein